MPEDNNSAEDRNETNSPDNNSSVNSIIEMIRSIELAPTPKIKVLKKKSKPDKEK